MPKQDNCSHVFIKEKDDLARRINEQACKLYNGLVNLDIATLNTEDTYRNYFRDHHLGRRLFFSMQNSSHIIYHSVKKSGKAVHEITFLDYGAGLGTLFMLAGMIGFKQVVYNDYFPEWHQPAKALCTTFEIKIDNFIAGDIDKVVKEAAGSNTLYDIIASRNVIEHIYSLPQFYQCIAKHNRKTVVYSTTTANYHNPAMRWYHVYLHRKWEKKAYYPQRVSEIKKRFPGAKTPAIESMARLTRGKAQDDFTNALAAITGGRIPVKDAALRSNTCDCITGVWNEHLLTKTEYNSIITKAGFAMQYTPGYWDTHYRSAAMNIMARCLNKLIAVTGNRGVFLSPFVNVIAYN